MTCEYYKHPIYLCQGSGKLYCDEPEKIYENDTPHSCVPNTPMARLITACFEKASTTVGDPKDLFNIVCQRFESCTFI